MWRLSHEKRVALIRCLVEGNPMRGRLNTVVRLLREIGPLADQYHHENVRGVISRRVQLDEIWTFIAAQGEARQGGRAP